MKWFVIVPLVILILLVIGIAVSWAVLWGLFVAFQSDSAGTDSGRTESVKARPDDA